MKGKLYEIIVFVSDGKKLLFEDCTAKWIDELMIDYREILLKVIYLNY